MFLLDLFLVASAFRRSCNWGLVFIWFCSWSFSMFWHKISFSVCFCTWLNPLEIWKVGPKLRKSFCDCVSSWSERFRNLSSLFIQKFQPETKTLIWKLERILIKTYRKNVSLLSDQARLNGRLLPNYTHINTHTCIYIYIYMTQSLILKTFYWSI